jgi:hypothetical protein
MAKETKSATKSGREEQIGFHKGALTTLAKEREELLRIVNVVEQLMQMHVKSLKELGVDIASQAAQQKKKLDDIL